MIGWIAFRMAAVEALKGATSVGDNVLDSEIGALDVAADGSLRTDQEKAFISVYVEGVKQESGSDVLRALHRSGPTDLIIEFGITSAMTRVVDEETGETELIGLQIPPTDAAFEFFLGVVGREVVNALTDPRNAWAEIWRALSSGILKVERKRTADASNGVRVAAHQLIVTVDLLPDPVFGEPVAPTSIWKKFFDKLATSTDPVVLKKRAAMLALIGDGEAVLGSEAQQRRFGMTLEEVRALSDLPPPPAEAAEPNITSVSFDQGA